MKNWILASGFILVLFSSEYVHAVIYGTDNRREVLAGPTLAWFSPKVGIASNSSGRIDLDFPSVNDPDGIGLCADERFSGQPAIPVTCTGFLVAPDLLVTAGHCAVNYGEVNQQANPYCTDFSWLLDYQVAADGSVEMRNISRDRIVTCKQVIRAVYDPAYDATHDHNIYNRDFALVQLSRSLTDRVPLKLSKGGVRVGDPVYMMGYPYGLPAKLTSNGKVIADNHPEYFRTDLDAIEGDSGGPVFNSKGEVVGILVRGFPSHDTTTDPKQGCSRSNRCDFTTGHCTEDDHQYPIGAEVQKISEIARLLSNRL